MILSRTARSAAASGGLRSLTRSSTRTECRPSDQGRFLGGLIWNRCWTHRAWRRLVAVHHAPCATALRGCRESADTPVDWGIARGTSEAWQSGGAVGFRRRSKRLKWGGAVLG